MQAIKTILVPVDFSAGSDKALAYAIDLARRLQAAVTVMNAYEIPVYGFPDGAMIATAEVAARIADVSQKALDAAAQRSEGQGVKISKVLRQGPAWAEINAAVESVGADLIVMGTQGRSGLSRAFLGSVAEKVLRTATCPVLVIRDHAA
jgi:nucleotide-binding universal stress UspA family protein